MFRSDSAGLLQRSALTVPVYLRPCGIGGRVGLVLAPGLLIGAAENFLCWAKIFSCADAGMCITVKHQKKR